MLAAVAFLCASVPVRAQYLNAYKTGLDAIEAQDWERAASAMTEAIAERREEKMKLPARLFLRPYVPFFYLGYARFKSGDCEGALTAWDESERQGVLAKLEEAELARRGREECANRARQRELGQARQEAQQLLARVSSIAAAVHDLARDEHGREVWTRGDPSPASRHAEALERIRRARELLADEAVDRDGILRAEALVRDASTALDGLRADVERLIQERHGEVERKDKNIDERVADARKLLARTAYLAPYPRLVGKARADLEGLVAEAARRDAASRVHLDGLAARLENSIEELNRLSAAPPEALGVAVEAYLAGRHGEVIAALAEARFTERRARGHALLLLAASRHALYLEGGELDHELLMAAAEDVRACHSEDAGLAPPQRFFSPRFIEFFSASLASTPPS